MLTDCLNKRELLLNQKKQAAAGGGGENYNCFQLAWWRDLKKRKYRRFYGAVSPALRLAFLPRIVTAFATRSRFGEEIAWWFLLPLLAGIFSPILTTLTSSPPPQNEIIVLFFLSMVVGCLAGILLLLPVAVLRRKVRKRWQQRANTRRLSFLDSCNEIVQGTSQGYNTHGYQQRWLNRMRAYV